MNNKRSLSSSLKVALGSAAVLAAVATPATAVDFEYSGYLRAHLSMNLSSNSTFKNGLDESSNQGGRHELSMARFSGKIESSWDFGKFQIGSVFRVVEEHETSYEQGLENSTFLGPVAVSNNLLVTSPLAAVLGLPPMPGLTPFTTGLAGFLPGAPGTNSSIDGINALTSYLAQAGIPTGLPLLPCQTVATGGCDTTPFTGWNASFAGAGAQRGFLSDYDENDFHDMMRELYVTFDVGSRTHFKLGKQQVVWGETDFFRAMDIVHGYDLTWRSFLETENEELRKPLILANVEIDIPEWGGTLQLVYRPGWDEGADVGTTAPLGGSRWAPQPWTGNNVPSSVIGPRNFHHSKGDEDDDNYGFRWSGVYNQIGYSLAYWRGLDNDGLVVRNPIVGGTTNYGEWEQNSAAFAGYVPGSSQNLTNLISPEIETFGLSLNAYFESLDIVGRAEFAFTPDKPYNTGTNTSADLFAFGLGCTDSNLGANGIPSCAGIPGILGAVEGIAIAGGVPIGVGTFGSLAGDAFDIPVLLDSVDNVTGVATSASAGLLTMSVPGLGKVVEKDTLRIMVGFDKNLNLMDVLGTQRPSFWTVQLFDTWITNFDKDDDIVDLFGFGSAKREHSTILTNAIVLNYDYDTINPGLAVGVDLGNFDMFLIPSVDFVFGDHWRLKVEADIFLPRHSKTKNLGFKVNDTRLLGTLDDNDQLVVRLTYQF